MEHRSAELAAELQSDPFKAWIMATASRRAPRRLAAGMATLSLLLQIVISAFHLVAASAGLLSAGGGVAGALALCSAATARGAAFSNVAAPQRRGGDRLAANDERIPAGGPEEGCPICLAAADPSFAAAEGGSEFIILQTCQILRAACVEVVPPGDRRGASVKSRGPPSPWRGGSAP